MFKHNKRSIHTRYDYFSPFQQYICLGGIWNVTVFPTALCDVLHQNVRCADVMPSPDSITLELRAEQTHPSLSGSRQVATMKKVTNAEEKKIFQFTQYELRLCWGTGSVQGPHRQDRGDRHTRRCEPQSQGLSTWGPVHLKRDPPSLGGCGRGRGQGARISLHRASNPLPWTGHSRIFVDSHHSM